MTNRNPASPYSQPSDISKEIISRVSAHADRSLDRIFADIDDLLSDSSQPSTTPSTGDRTGNRPAAPYPSEPVLPPTPFRSESSGSESSSQSHPPSGSLNQHNLAQYSSPPPEFPPSSSFDSHQEPETTPPHHSQPPTRKKFLPGWSKVLLGIGITSVALSGLLLWLINERKIQVPKNLDLTWVPFLSKSSISPEDAKFAEYMRKSIAKIDAANQANSNQPANNNATPETAAPTITTTTSSPAPFTTSSTGVVTSTTPATIPIGLLNILADGKRPGAEFEIEGKVVKVYVGEKIGNSNWSLVTVAKGEVIVKKVSGEIRSIYLGQKF